MKFKEAFFKSTNYFQKIRIKMWEAQYEKEIRNQDELKDFDVVHDKLIELIGPENSTLLIQYTDMVVAQYNVDSSYFYSAGFTDCQDTYDLYRSILKGSEHIPEIEDKPDVELAEEINELINS